MTRFYPILVVLMVVGCDKAPSGNGGTSTPAAAAPSGPPAGPAARALGEEGGSFFWFNSRAISDSGNAHYSRFAYGKLLPLLSPSEQKNPEAWFVVQDGDFLGGGTLPSAGAEEDRILAEVDRIGRSLCYAIAVYGAAGLSPEDMDSRLRSGKTTGYLGRTTAPGTSAEKFVRLGMAIGLPIAFRIDGARLKKIGFEFFSDQELKALGFEPVPGK